MFHSQSAWTASVRLEKITRPFAEAKSILPPPSRPPVAVPVGEEEDPEAFLEWGSSGATTVVPDPIEDLDADGFMNDKFEGSTFSPSTVGEAGQRKPPNQKKPQDDRPGVVTANEIDRQTIKFKVYNPEDKEQWVIVEAVKSIRFRLPDGHIFKMNMKPKPPPGRPATDAESSSE